MNREENLDMGFALPLVEAFYSLQGEGAFCGHPAFFIRLAGCKVCCPFCDSKNTWDATNFPRVSIQELVHCAEQAPASIVVITGGEPLLHPLFELTTALHRIGKRLHIETSGSEPFSGEWEWVCLSPKSLAPVLESNWLRVNELKVVVAREEDFIRAEAYADKLLQFCDRPVLSLQGEWGQRGLMQKKIIDYIQEHPRWRLSVQLHKYLQVR